MAQDHYETLGIGRDADADEIKKAYRRLAKRYHPDRNQGDADAERKFKEINAAHDVLSDPDKRAHYDHFGADGAAFGGGGGFEGIDMEDVSRVFDGIFGEGFGGFGGFGARARKSRPRAARVAVELELSEALRGARRHLELEMPAACDDCGGSGAAAGSEPVICASCGGDGQLRAAQGFFSVQRTCPECRGRGRVIDNPCGVCRGQGQVRRKRVLDIDIPAGVDDGMSLRMKDVLVDIRVRPHHLFERDGAHLHCRLPLDFGEAALGTEIEIPTLEGRTAIKVPPGTANGARLRLAGKGAPQPNGGRRGDLFCHVEVNTPKKPDKRRRELLGELRDIERRRPSAQRQSWLKDMGDFFS